MIIIDTNVISEMMRDEPDPNVLAWTATAAPLHTSAVTLAEVETESLGYPAEVVGTS